MATRRRRTRSNSDKPDTNANDAKQDVDVPKDTDVLFGSCEFLDSHPGTILWANVVGSYSQQYYWSSNLYQKIRNDKRILGKQYFVLLKKNKFRPATELEIEQRTCGVFDNGGGKKKQPRKRRASSGDVSVTGTTSAALNSSEVREFQTGDSVYVYDQLWRAKVVEVGDFVDGRKFKVHYLGFLATADQWVDPLQIFPSSEKMKEIYHQIDKAEGTAYQGEYDVLETIGNADEDDDADDDDDEHVARAKKRRKTQANGEKGSETAAPKASINTRRSRSSSNVSTAAVSESSITNKDEPNLISASDYNNVTKLASDGATEVLSHRLFSVRQKPNSTNENNSKATRVRASTTESTATTAASVDSNSTLDLSQIVTDSLEKCEMAQKKAKEAGMASIVPLLNGEAANWSLRVIKQYLNVLEIQANLPPLDQMQSDVDKWKQEGGIRGLEAMAMERNIEKWNKAQEYLARFVECLVEDL